MQKSGCAGFLLGTQLTDAMGEDGIIRGLGLAFLAQAEDLVAKAHERCPYSNAVRGNVDVTLTLL